MRRTPLTTTPRWKEYFVLMLFRREQINRLLDFGSLERLEKQTYRKTMQTQNHITANELVQTE